MTRTPAGGTPAPRWSIAALVASVVATAATGALGPSAAVAPLPGPRLGILPPYFFTDPVTGSAPAEVVTVLLAISVLAGAAGVVGGLRALATGWRPDPRRLAAAGALAVAALAVLPPIGSADPKSYAAYGRMVATGQDPYRTTPAQLARAGDPVGAAVESPWQDSSSVYGPLATAEQAWVAKVASDSTRAAVGLLGLANAIAFVAAGGLLMRWARSPSRQRRVALLWFANPLLLLQLVSGAHLDTVVAFAVVAAIVVNSAPSPGAISRRTMGRALAAGAAAGAGAAVKLPGGAVAAVLAWQSRRSPARLTGVLAGAGTVLVGGYVLAGPHALDQVRRASRFVSHATPWRPLAVALDHAVGTDISRTIINFAATALLLLFAALFLRAMPGAGQPKVSAARATLALTLAYLLTTPYVLPWYAATAWALLTLLPASNFDWVLLAHTTVLSLAYLPGRDIVLPSPLGRIADVTRNDCAPYLLLAVGILAVVVSRRRLRAAPVPSAARRFVEQ